MRPAFYIEVAVAVPVAVAVAVAAAAAFGVLVVVVVVVVVMVLVAIVVVRLVPVLSGCTPLCLGFFPRDEARFKRRVGGAGGGRSASPRKAFQVPCSFPTRGQEEEKAEEEEAEEEEEEEV